MEGARPKRDLHVDSQESPLVLSPIVDPTPSTGRAINPTCLDRLRVMPCPEADFRETGLSVEVHSVLPDQGGFKNELTMGRCDIYEAFGVLDFFLSAMTPDLGFRV